MKRREISLIVECIITMMDEINLKSSNSEFFYHVQRLEN